MNDLPTWPGADVVYKRLGQINNKLAAEAYANGKRKGRKIVWTLPEFVADNILAMNKGDEEACKAGVARHLHLIEV